MGVATDRPKSNQTNRTIDKMIGDVKKTVSTQKKARAVPSDGFDLT